MVPFGCHGGTGSKGLVHDCVINCVAIEHGGIRGQYLPVELGAEHCAVEVFRIDGCSNLRQG